MRKRKTRGEGGKTGKAQAGIETGEETGSEAGKARKTGREADTETGSLGSVRANQSVWFSAVRMLLSASTPPTF
jgi:hypothetical protein